jgi:penicillin amidase
LRGLGRAAAPALRAASRAAILPGDGTLRLAGLSGPAEVRFDEHGIPHVRAATDADAFRLQGWCHARDRYFQMDMLRRVLRGGLGEVVGERPIGSLALPPFGQDATTVDADRLMRVLDLPGAARRVWARGGAEGRALLRAYVQGVNAAVAQQRRRRPLEYRLLRLPLEPWRPLDSILVAKGLALGLSFKWRSSPVFAAVAERLRDDPRALAAVLPPVPGAGALAITRCVAEGLGRALRFVPAAPPTGSNAWLVGGGRTRGGRPIVASDPHLELSLPGIWYLASLRGSRYRAVGCSLPGLPGVVVGRTPSVAWALTNAMLDDCDLWLEELDATGTRYRVDGRWRSLGRRVHEIRRRGAAPVYATVRRTHRGPLLGDAFPDEATPPLSLRLALHEATPDMEAFLGLGRARDVGEALSALEGYGAPAQNLLVADTAGRAHYRLVGQVPRRALDAHPALPRDGTTSASDWQGFAAGAELPHLEVEPRGQVVSANHPPVQGDYPLYLSHLYEPDYRAERIAALLDGRDDLDAEAMRRVQADARSVAATRFRAGVLAPHADAVRRLRPTLGPLLDVMLGWEGDERAGARGPVAWHLAYHHLALRVFAPRLGAELVRHWMGVINLVDEALQRAFEDEASPWAPPAERAALLCAALEDTARDLQARGLQPDAPWGSLHVLALRHPLGRAAVLAPAFDRGPWPLDGGPYSVVSGQYVHVRPGPVVTGPSYRHVVDLAEPEAARMVTFGGQSGHVGSPHYDDLTPLWLAQETVPMRLEEPPAGGSRLAVLPR